MITKSDFVDSKISAFFSAINPVARRGSYTLPTEVSGVSTDTNRLARLAMLNPPREHVADVGPGEYRVIPHELLTPASSSQSSTSISKAKQAEVARSIREMLLARRRDSVDSAQDETTDVPVSRLSQEIVTSSGKSSPATR